MINGVALTVVTVSINFDPERGVSYGGTDKVNELLAQGWRVKLVQGPNAIMRNVGTDGETVRLAFMGSTIKMTMEPPQ